MTTAKTIAELRELLARATPGPWFMDNGAGVSHRVWPYFHPLAATHRPRPFDKQNQADEQIANAALIVALRNAAPALLDHIAALEARALAAEKTRDEALAALGAPAPSRKELAECWHRHMRYKAITG